MNPSVPSDAGRRNSLAGPSKKDGKFTVFFFRPAGQVITMFRTRRGRRARGKGAKELGRKSGEDGECKSTKGKMEEW